MHRNLLYVATVITTALLAGRAEAQQYTGAGYPDELTALEARVQELEAELEAAYDGGCDACCLSPTTWFDSCCCGPTWAFSVNGDGWKDIAEFGVENNFGNRFALDATWDLGGNGLRAHLGGGYGLYDYHGRLFDLNASSAEQQVYLTAGVYRRGSGCCGDDWTWGVSYDFLHDNHYGFYGEAVDVHQVRFLAGRLLNPCNEFGVWGAVGIDDDPLFLGGEEAVAVVEAQDQLNLYWRRYFEFGGETMLYAGLAIPNPELLQMPDDDLSEVVIGLRGIAPLTCNVGLVGGVHYVIPSASGGFRRLGDAAGPLEESWNVTFGVVWVRGCSLPVLPVADNGWMTKRIAEFDFTPF